MNANASEMEDDDLYGDLDENMNNPTTKPSVILVSSSMPTSSSSKPHKQKQTHQINIQQEREDIQALSKELTIIKEENGVLKRNMGTLYRTAKVELDRKDDRIRRLEEELSRR